MVYGVYVATNRFEGKLVFSSTQFAETVKVAKKKDRRNWVWVQVISVGRA
jgi:hypothetical protein